MRTAWVVHLISAWVLIQGVVVTLALSRFLSSLSIGGITIPLVGIVPLVALVASGVVLFRRGRGSRWIATGILAWVSIGALKIVLSRIFGVWPYEYTMLNQVYSIGYLCINTLCFVFMWKSRAKNPYSRARTSSSESVE